MVKSRKNQKSVLVPAGRWVITGFTYGRSRCTCCGRPIVHVLHLKNLDHNEKLKVDPTYAHSEVIDIGRTCGPQVFKESTIGFYEDPSREWNRQYLAFKDYISFVIICAKSLEFWKSSIPDEIRVKVDQYLEQGQPETEHSGGWWSLRDAKKSYLMTPFNERTNIRILWNKSRSLVYSAKRLKLIPMSWELAQDMRLIKHEQQRED